MCVVSNILDFLYQKLIRSDFASVENSSPEFSQYRKNF